MAAGSGGPGGSCGVDVPTRPAYGRHPQIPAGIHQNGPVTADLPPGATITYEFHDSSVPPPYHRSYRLTFDHSGARMVVDSYGEVLADRTAAMPVEAWDQVTQTFPEVSSLTVAEPEQGCTGGTSFALSVADGGATSFALHGSDCGGANSEAADRLTRWVGPVRALFPPMSELAPDGS